MNSNSQLRTLDKTLHLSPMLAALVLGAAGNAWADEKDTAAIQDLSLEDLAQVKVYTVSRKLQSLSQTAAAAFIITQEDIRRSGASSIPEALRLAPGLEVAQIGASTWAITARGFNGQFARKLLVLMDGRTLYTPVFSGVYWDLQDTMMEDIDHIEVIRGPGAATWGANAVNGVINIITKKSADTQGNLAVAGAGNQQRAFAGFRHGGQLGEDGHYRVYGKGFERNNTVSDTGQSQDDSWRAGQLGFRIDRRISSDDRITLQGDTYRMRVGAPFRPATLIPPYASYIPQDDRAEGGNVMARWERTLADASEMTLQGYYDRVQFKSPILSNTMETFDIDFQYRLHPNTTHDLIWGANYRYIRSASGNTAEVFFTPEKIDYQNFSVFVQDEIALVANRLRLTLGAKVEKSHFGGTQFQPNVRLLWTPDSKNSVWFAASKASRTPSQGEANSNLSLGVTPPSPQTFGLPVEATLYGNPNMPSEKVTALELGYRTQWSPRLSSDIAAFVNRYRNLSEFAYVGGAPTPTFELTPVPHLALPFQYVVSSASTKTHGLEIWAHWRALDWMRLEAAYTYLKVKDPPGLGGTDALAVPRDQELLRCLLDLSARSKLDFTLRHVGSLPSTTQSPGLPAYTAVDARLAYSPSKGLELSLVAQNLFDKRHAEFGGSVSQSQPPGQIPRGVYAKAVWSF